MLLQPVAKGVELPKQAVSSVAQCVAVLCVHTDDAGQRDSTIERFMADVSNRDLEETAQRLTVRPSMTHSDSQSEASIPLLPPDRPAINCCTRTNQLSEITPGFGFRNYAREHKGGGRI